MATKSRLPRPGDRVMLKDGRMVVVRSIVANGDRGGDWQLAVDDGSPSRDLSAGRVVNLADVQVLPH